ncbi:MAG: hypothetical protein ABL892_09495 [Thiobacillaceae bacterium]
MLIECYAQRLLNPYRGVVHTIRYQSAEAVTTDGVEWDIYVANDALLEGLGRAGRRAQISDIRYGHWSAESGLKRGALYPSEDFRRLEDMGAVVYEHLLKVHRDVPFSFRDHFELWLLDANNLPLALLHSVLTETDTETQPPLDWRAGIAAQAQFRSTAIENLHESAGAYLTRHINALMHHVQWFVRTDDGAGLGLRVVQGDAQLKGRVLDAELFPLLYLSTTKMDAAHAQLVQDYHAWQSPWMLLLPHLDGALRCTMESHARLYAEAIEKHYRLYPAIIDRNMLQAARVEAAFIRSQPVKQSSEEVLSLDYFELNRK